MPGRFLRRREAAFILLGLVLGALLVGIPWLVISMQTPQNTASATTPAKSPETGVTPTNAPEQNLTPSPVPPRPTGAPPIIPPGTPVPYPRSTVQPAPPAPFDRSVPFYSPDPLKPVRAHT